MIATAIAFTSCGEQRGQTPAESLIERLNYHVSQGQILFGHQDSYLYGPPIIKPGIINKVPPIKRL